MLCEGVEATGRGVHKDSPACAASHRWRQGATTHRRGSGQERSADQVSTLIIQSNPHVTKLELGAVKRADVLNKFFI